MDQISETSARMKHYSEVSRIHPSTCDCHACRMNGKGGSILEPIIGLIALPFQYASMKKEQEKYKEEQKIEKARQAAASYRDAKQYAEFLAAERHHKSEIKKEKAHQAKEKNIGYIVYGLITAVISGILLLGNFVVCWAFGMQSDNVFSYFISLVAMLGLFGAGCGVVGIIEPKS